MEIEILILMSGYVIARNTVSGEILPEYSGPMLEAFKVINKLEGFTINNVYIKKVHYVLLLEVDGYFEKVKAGKDYGNFVTVIANATSNCNNEDIQLLVDTLLKCKNMPDEATNILLEVVSKAIPSNDKAF